jgi:hypothetical protein
MTMPNIIEDGYVDDWRRVLIGWLGWTDERFERFVSAFNSKLRRHGGTAWFHHEAPLYYIVPLLVRNQFDERLRSNMRRPEYGAPEWSYFRREMQHAIEGGAGYYSGNFDWNAARDRALKHLVSYGERFPLPEEVTNLEIDILNPTASRYT